MTTSATLAALLQAFFTDRLLQQRQASPHTVAVYRDSFRLLLRYAETELGRQPSDLLLEDLDVHFISGFLQHIEQDQTLHCAEVTYLVDFIRSSRRGVHLRRRARRLEAIVTDE